MVIKERAERNLREYVLSHFWRAVLWAAVLNDEHVAICCRRTNILSNWDLELLGVILRRGSRMPTRRSDSLFPSGLYVYWKVFHNRLRSVIIVEIIIVETTARPWQNCFLRRLTWRLWRWRAGSSEPRCTRTSRQPRCVGSHFHEKYYYWASISSSFWGFFA